MHSGKPLGRLLVTSGLLTQQALDEVLSLQKADGRRLGELLSEKGLVRPHQLAQFLSHQLACPWVSLERVEISREAVEVLPRRLALKHHMVPVHLRTSKGATALYVAMDDPTDDIALAEAAAAATMPVKAMIALTSEIRMYLDRLYGVGATGTTNAPPPVRTPPAPLTSAKEETSTRAGPSRPPKPPPPPRSTTPPPEDAAILDMTDALEDAPRSHPSPSAIVLVVDVGDGFIDSVRAAAARYGGVTIGISLADGPKAIADHAPCAVVVTEETYSNERSEIDRLALEAGALLIVSSAPFEGRHVEALLEGAIKRFSRSAYEKGSIVDGRYELVRDLGGRVAGSRWEVRHLRTSRRALLKIGVRAANDDSDAEAVQRERVALAGFHHPGAIDLRDAGSTENADPFVVVEMLEGRTLEGLVAARGALPPADACEVLRQLADVLVTAHDAGVRHGDVRPENVLVVRDAWGVERVKLVHWEAASVTDGPPDTAVDLAGIGACAFLALAGRTRNEGEAVRSIRSGKWAPLNFPPAIATVIARTLGGAGADRFTSAREFVEALEAAAPQAPSALRLLDSRPELRRGSMTPGPTTEAALGSETPSEMDHDWEAGELRRFSRAAYHTPVRVEVPGIGTIEGRSEDVSERGIFIVTRGKIDDGAEVTIRFALPIDGTVVSESGVVRWSRAPHASDSGGSARAIGIELISPGEECVRQLARYVSALASQDTSTGSLSPS